MYNQYDWYLDSIDKVGCIYTAQGLGFDYVGLFGGMILYGEQIIGRVILIRLPDTMSN